MAFTDLHEIGAMFERFVVFDLARELATGATYIIHRKSVEELPPEERAAQQAERRDYLERRRHFDPEYYVKQNTRAAARRAAERDDEVLLEYRRLKQRESRARKTPAVLAADRARWRSATKDRMAVDAAFAAKIKQQRKVRKKRERERAKAARAQRRK